MVAAPARFGPPQPVMRKYDGISVSSKNKKNKIRSRLTKLPMQPTSSRSNQATKDLVRRCSEAPRSTIGISRAVSRTMKSEMPSTPVSQEIPSADAQECCVTN